MKGPATTSRASEVSLGETAIYLMMRNTRIMTFRSLRESGEGERRDVDKQIDVYIELMNLNPL